MTNTWNDFYNVTRDRPHWPIVEQAVEMLGIKGKALDLGCGAGRDTRWLISQGWKVTAVDQEPEAIALLGDVVSENLTAVQSSISDFEFTPGAYDLISAQFSLPFLPRSEFFGAFARLKEAIRPGGLFVGQFFGVRDSWNDGERDMTFLTREEVDQQLEGLTVLELKEDDHDGTTALGTEKHWHVYHIMARR